MSDPNLDFYRRRAKELLKHALAGDESARARITKHSNTQTPALHDAQLAIARENGFSSWPRLKAYVTAMERSREQSPEDRLQSIIRACDFEALDAFLEKYPDAPAMRIKPLGFTPLHVAATVGWEQGSARLIDAGADINALSAEMRLSPLKTAIGYGKPALARYLMERGASPTVGDAPERSIMQAAAYAGDREMILELAVRGVPVDVFAAVTLEDENQLRSLVARDATVLKQRMRPYMNVTLSPLHLAAIQNSTRMIDALIDLGAAPNDTDEQGRTPIDLALNAGRRQACERLQQHGCQPNPDLLALVGSTERAERIARLHQALVDGNKAVVVDELDADPSLLNQRFPDVWGTGGTFGAAPLHWAAMLGQVELLRLLLERGADVHLQDLTYSATPLGWANEYRRREAAALLRAHGATESRD